MLALGLDDVAGIDADSSREMGGRIDALMSRLGKQPAMWVNLKTQLEMGPLAEDKMDLWNRALRGACRQYPSMRVFNWAGAARSGWFAEDGIQFTKQGYRARGSLIATALTDAFPAMGDRPQADDAGRDCAVSLRPEAVKHATAPPTSFDVSFAGDITPGSSYGLPPDNARAMFGSVREEVSAEDLAIGNLEGTLSVGGASKCGVDTSTCFSFQAPPENAEGLRWAGFDLLNVGNNHAFDFGSDGQKQTIKALDREGLQHTGLPDEVTIVDAKSTRVGVIGFAPYEWSNPVEDLGREAALIQAAQRRADVVIVVAHLGAEGSDQSHTPSGTEYAFGEARGDTRAFAHNAIDAGASLVLASGPHVLRGMERYRGGLIAYSLGNFAGWENFSTAGILSESALLEVHLSGSGRVADGRIIPLRLVGPGIPELDESGAAITTVDALGEQDFGADGVSLDAGGRFEFHSSP